MSLIWQTKELGDLFRVGSSKRVLKSQWKKEGVPFYRGREITSLANSGRVDNELFISEELYSNYAKKYGVPNTGDIVITAIGTIGNSYVVKKEDKFYFKDASVLWLNKIVDIDTDFVNLWFKSPSFKEQLGKGNGATVDTLTIQKLESLKVPMPSLAEQKQIVKLLNEVFEKVTKAKKAAEKNFQNSRELFETYVQGIFSNPGKDWEERRLSELLEIERGGSPRPIKKFLTNDPDGINWIKIGDTKDSDKYITATAQKIKPEGLKKSRLVHPGDFLLSNSMSFGRPYILKITGAIHDGWLVLREKDPNLIDKDYLYNILGSAYVFSQFDKLAAGSTVRNLNINLVSGVRIPVPKISEQKAIVKKLDAMYAQTKRLGEIYEQKLADLEELKKSTLKRAFSGDLSTTISAVSASPQAAVAVPSPYIRNQVHAAIVDQVVQDKGSTTEVAVAKYDHLLQELCGLPLGYQFATHQFGPFDNQIKRLVSSGLGRNKWFTKRSGMIVFGSNVSALLSRQSNLYRSAQASMRELSRLGITKLDADGIELLSTVCHSIKQTGSVAIDPVRIFMSNWQTDNNARTKAEKFSEERTQKCLDFILKNNLHQKLLPTT